MADYSAIRDGLKTRLATSSTFIQVADTVPDVVSPPAAIVMPGSPVAQYDQAFGNGLQLFVFQVLILTQRFDTAANQDLIDGLISGAGSVKTLIEGDLTLGGAASTLQVTSAANYQDYEAMEVTYLGIEFTVEVWA
jgi:hypothetical protein